MREWIKDLNNIIPKHTEREKERENVQIVAYNCEGETMYGGVVRRRKSREKRTLPPYSAAQWLVSVLRFTHIKKNVWSFQLNYAISKINSFPLVFLDFSSVYRRVSMRMERCMLTFIIYTVYNTQMWRIVFNKKKFTNVLNMRFWLFVYLEEKDFFSIFFILLK